MNGTFAPRREEEVCELLRWALAEQQPLRIAGLDTKAGFGLPCEELPVLSLRGLSGILDYQPEELVMRAAAGTPIEEVEAALREHRQMLAFEPPVLGPLYGKAGAGTLGGLFAANLSGPRRFRAGAARDHILGVRAVSGRGESWRSGGNVIKNVTGYDLSRLMAGSWGTLSVLTEVTFKVLPAPAAGLTLALPAPDPVAALSLVRALAAGTLEPSGLALLPQLRGCAVPAALLPGFDSAVLVRFEGTAAALAERRAALEARLMQGPVALSLAGEDSARLWRAVRDVEPLQDRAIIVKVSVPATAAAGVLAALPQDAAWYVDAAGGWLWVGLDVPGAVEAIGALRAHLGGRGSCVIWRAPPGVRQDAGVFSPMDPVLAALSRRLRQSFDPHGILNPGRLSAA